VLQAVHSFQQAVRQAREAADQKQGYWEGGSRDGVRERPLHSLLLNSPFKLTLTVETAQISHAVYIFLPELCAQRSREDTWGVLGEAAGASQGLDKEGTRQYELV
jgi:hypothetical protein